MTKDITIKETATTVGALIMIMGGTTLSAQIHPTGYASKTTVGGTDVCLYSESATPKMGIGSTDEQTYVWRYAPDEMGIATEIRRTTGRSDTVAVTRPGLYSVETSTNKYTMWWLCPVPAGVTFVTDSADCDALYVTATVVADTIEVAGSKIAQKIVFHWEAKGEELQTSMTPDAAIEGFYDEGDLTVRAINQALNEATYTDTVHPKGVRAAFSFNNRKTAAINESVETGDLISSPAEVEFTNESKGSYTVSEWTIGSVARLYEKNPVYQFQQPGKHTIALTVTNENTGCAHTDSSTTITVSEAALEFPNAFTPNGDGVNDIFLPAFRSIKNYELTIYNRWGRRIFSSSDPTEGWDGNENGRKAATGTYYFVATAEGYEDNVSFKRKGSITLIR